MNRHTVHTDRQQCTHTKYVCMHMQTPTTVVGCWQYFVLRSRGIARLVECQIRGLMGILLTSLFFLSKESFFQIPQMEKRNTENTGSAEQTIGVTEWLLCTVCSIIYNPDLGLQESDLGGSKSWLFGSNHSHI